MAWLLNLIYGLLLLVLSPVLLYRVVVLGKYRAGWAEKLLGRLPQRDSEKFCIWFHAVSVGEVPATANRGAGTSKSPAELGNLDQHHHPHRA